MFNNKSLAWELALSIEDSWSFNYKLVYIEDSLIIVVCGSEFASLLYQSLH